MALKRIPDFTSLLAAGVTIADLVAIWDDSVPEQKYISIANLIAAFKLLDLNDNFAPLVGGLVPAANLPSYVDDVLEFANLAAFPAEGETGKIYVALDTNFIYRWTGTVYVQIASAGASISNQGDNRIITATGTADSLNAEANFTFDGTTATVTGVLNVDNVRLDGNTISALENQFFIKNALNAPTTNDQRIEFITDFNTSNDASATGGNALMNFRYNNLDVANQDPAVKNYFKFYNGASDGGVDLLTLSRSKNLIVNSGRILANGGTFLDVTNQIVLGTTITTTITSPAPAASRTYTIPDALGAANFALTDAGVTNRVPYWTNTGKMANSANLTFDGTQLALGGATPNIVLGSVLQIAVEGGHSFIESVGGADLDIAGRDVSIEGTSVTLKTVANGNILLTPNGTGTLGINTATPFAGGSVKLNVNGNVIMANTNTAGSVFLGLGEDFSGSTPFFIERFGSTHATTPLQTILSSSGQMNLRVNTAIRVIIATDGKVGIGRTPATNLLEVEGNASKTTAGDWLANSDSLIKTKVQTIEGAWNRIKQVRPVTFKYDTAYLSLHPSITDKFYQNVIAQEFETIYPNYVYSSGETFKGDSIKQVDTHPMMMDAVKALQEALIKIEELEARLEILESN